MNEEYRMEKEPLESPRKSIFSKGRVVAIGLVMSALVLVGAGLVVHFLPANGQTASVAHASGGGGGGCVTTNGPVCTFKGSTALVDFFSASADGCVQTSGFVEAMESVTHNPPGPQVDGTTVFISLFQDDFCNNTFVDDFGQASGLDFQADKALNSASLSGDIPVFDSNTGTIFTVTVNLAWQGIGATSKQVDISHFRSPGTIINNHFVGTNRAAIVTGTLSFGTVSISSPPSLSSNGGSGFFIASAAPLSGGGGGGGGFSGGELEYAQSGSVQIIH
jgi:hypothetical protein